jgi:transcription elongation factor Elf1
MLSTVCPWCEEEARLPLLELQEPEATFICAECGTSVSFVEEPVELELAA